MKFTSRFFLILLTLNFSIQAKLLDKISAIIDENIITQSQINRSLKNLAVKKSVAPMIYEKDNYSTNEIVDLTLHKFMIRSKLVELGYTITDDQVEQQIKANEKRLNIDRPQLFTFLKQQNSTFDEYFETLREAIEYSYFVNRVISPVISVSEQDVKNAYFKKYAKDSRLNFKYNLIDYSIAKDDAKKLEKGQLENIVKQYRTNNILPESFSTLSNTTLDDITEDGVTAELKSALKFTDEGSLTSVIVIENKYHVFYITKKDLVETEKFSKEKEKIQETLFESQVKNETALWLERERNKHYIKISI